MVKIVWTPLAISDVKNIHDYISTESPVYANRMIEKFIERVGLLYSILSQAGLFPSLGKNQLEN